MVTVAKAKEKGKSNFNRPAASEIGPLLSAVSASLSCEDGALQNRNRHLKNGFLHELLILLFLFLYGEPWKR